MKEEKKLTLDKDNKIIGGVGSGLAKYLDVDPLLIRIALLFVLFNVNLLYGAIFYGITYWLLSDNEDKTNSENSYYEEPKEVTYEQEEFELDEIMDSHTGKENIEETSKEDVKDEEKIEEVWEEEPKLEGEEEVTTIDEELGNHENEIN